MSKYTEAVPDTGAIILCNGERMTKARILYVLQSQEAQLREAADVLIKSQAFHHEYLRSMGEVIVQKIDDK